MKKISRVLFGLFILVSLVGVAFGCQQTVKHTVTFNPNGGTLNSNETEKVEHDQLLTKPTDPSYDGHEFKGWWMSDDNGASLISEWVFEERKVTSDITLYAKWQAEDTGPISIEDLLDSGTSNASVEITGVIYGKASDGIYVSDSASGKIFVKSTSLGSVVVGDKVNVTGNYKINTNQRLIEATSITKASDQGVAVEAVSSSVEEVSKLSVTNKKGSWYKYVKIVGTVVYDEAMLETSLVSDNQSYEVLFDSRSNLDVLNAKQGSRIEVSVIVSGYDSFASEWIVLFLGSSVTDAKYSEGELKGVLEEYFDEEVIKTVVGGGLTLPANHPFIKDVSITWTTTLTDYIIIEPLASGSDVYQTVINVPDADAEGKLRAAVTYGSNAPFTIEIDVLVKTLVKQSLKDAINSAEYTSLFDAVVIGFAAGQNITFKSYIIQDLDDPSVISTVDYYGSDATGFGSYDDTVAIGDIVTFTARYRTSGRPCFNEVSTAKTSDSQAPVYDFDNAPALNAATWGQFPGHNTFVKLENPYMRYSTSSAPAATNWVRLGYAADAVGSNFGVVNNKTLAFLIRPLDELMGKSWRDNLGIPVTTGTPIMYDGDIYGFVLYESDTYFQFVAVDKSHFIPSHHLAVVEYLNENMVSRVEDGNVTLPTSHAYVTGSITWASSNAAVIATDGTVSYPENDTVVTLTATFKVDNITEPQTAEYQVLVVGRVRIVVEVDDALELGDGDMFNVGGYVLQVGYSESTTGSSTLNTIFLQDRNSGNIVIVSGLDELFKDSTIDIGYEIEFSGKLSIDSSSKITIIYETDLRVLSQNATLHDYKDNATEVTSHADALTEFGDFHFGQVFYFRGPVYINSTTTTGGITNLRFHLNANASAASDIQYNGKSLVFNTNSNKPVAGDDFIADLFGITTNPSTTRPGIKVNVDIYFVVKHYSDSYYYCVLLSADDVLELTDAILVERDIEAAIPKQVVAGNISLPSSHDLVTGDITWVSSEPSVIANDGTVTYPSEDKIVTLTATFVVATATLTVSVDVEVKKPVAKTVTEVISNSNSGEAVLVTGIIVGFHWNGSSTLNASSNGIMIKDATGNKIIYVTGLYGVYGSTRAEYKVGDNTLAKGDMIEFAAIYELSKTTGHNNRPTLVIQSLEAASLKIISRENTYTFDLSNAVEINDQDDLKAAAENLSYGTLYKLSGDFGFRGSASSYGTGVNLQVSFTRTAATDYNMPATWADRVQRFSIKFDGNEPNLGTKWWETMLGINSTTYTGTSDSGMSFNDGAYIYFYIGNALPTAATSNGYIQLVVLDAEWISATLETPTEG